MLIECGLFYGCQGQFSLYSSSDTTLTTKEDKMIDVNGHHDIKIIVKH